MTLKKKIQKLVVSLRKVSDKNKHTHFEGKKTFARGFISGHCLGKGSAFSVCADRLEEILSGKIVGKKR